MWLKANFMSSILCVECSSICKFYFTQREEGKRNNGVGLVFHRLVALHPVIDWVRGDIMLLVVDLRKRNLAEEAGTCQPPHPRRPPHRARRPEARTCTTELSQHVVDVSL